jgi:hypothetical protein
MKAKTGKNFISNLLSKKRCPQKDPKPHLATSGSRQVNPKSKTSQELD